MDYLITRLSSAFLCGLILSQAGSFIQIGTRNILASPSTLGIEGLSVLWILFIHTLALAAGMEWGWISLSGIPIFLLIGFVLAKLLGKEIRLERILFLGLTFNLLIGAVFSLWQFFFLAYNLPFPVEVWFGHFRFVESRGVLLLLGFEFVLLLLLGRHWRNLQLYSLGTEISRAHFADLESLYKYFFMFAVGGTFLVLSLFGAFSFLGLIFPLIARRIWFNKFDLKGEILLGSFANGLMFMLLDFLCYRFPVMGAEIPVGLIASVVGAVCLIAILGRTSKAPDFLANARK